MCLLQCVASDGVFYVPVTVKLKETVKSSKQPHSVLFFRHFYFLWTNLPTCFLLLWVGGGSLKSHCCVALVIFV